MSDVALPEAPCSSPARAPSKDSRARTKPERVPGSAAIDPTAEEKLPRAERRILTALSQYFDGRSMRQVAVLTGYSHKGGGFRNAIGALRTRGFVEGGQGRLIATDEGLAALGPIDPLPTGLELVEYWKRQPQLGRAERLILDSLVEAYPDVLTTDQIAERTGYEARGGGFRNALGKLRTLELIHGRGDIRAADMFFEGVC